MYTILEEDFLYISNLVISASLNCGSYTKWCPRYNYCGYGYRVCGYYCGYNNGSGYSRCCKY